MSFLVKNIDTLFKEFLILFNTLLWWQLHVRLRAYLRISLAHFVDDLHFWEIFTFYFFG